ncbi:PilZ domain-containing protein [Acidicapsa dinghuensis]|uniref:PilZ domain-containing protein n=1 Tax=Acidicapsa dinghuensis TaxID=2218256 RepID=A0ABW1ELF4_9BACT|nr:PilZ domain-containing protein [Acidicapsa dinghuensis]
MASVESPQDRELTANQPEFQSSAEEPRKRANRRAFPRHTVDCPVTVIPVGGVGQMAGSLSDVSLGGCLVRLQQRYLAGMLVRVEVQFQLRGIAFRILGVTVGTRGAQCFAIRFLDMPERRRAMLAEVLGEVATVNAARAEMAVQEDAPCEGETAADEAATLAVADVSVPPATSQKPKAPEEEKRMAQAVPASSEMRDSRPQDAQHLKVRERRSHDRHTVDTSVKLLLIKSAITMTGRIANLSMGGCRIRTDERFGVGIFVRVETEFYLHGLPFRIAGVSQAIQDKNTIGIRFLDMSERCRAQLVELIAEIEEAHALERDEPSITETQNAE